MLDERSEHLTYPLDLAQPDGSPLRVPLSVHARHTVDDVLTAFGILDFDKTAWKQTGVIRDERDELGPVLRDAREVRARVLAVHALQGLCDFADAVPLGVAVDDHAAVEDRAALHPPPEPWRQHPAVRAPRKKQDGRTMPYTFLGPADYVSHKGERPISFVWKLRRPMPADFFRQAKVASG